MYDVEMNKVKNKYTCSTLTIVFLMLSGCGGGGGGDGGNVNLDPFVGILYGSFEGVTESRGIWIWGDSVNSLCQQWSIATYNVSGWFYGTNFPWSSADVFVLESTTDPLSIIAAENFDYTSGSVNASVGDTVFFRGRNGFFGAWTLEEILGDADTRSTLSGTWYFRADGGGDFTGKQMEGDEPLRRGLCTEL